MSYLPRRKNRLAIPLAAALCSSVAFSQTAPAPSAAAPGAPAEQIITMEAFSVTGSNIKRTDQEKVLPVTVMNFEAIQARDAATPADMLVALPQITNIPNNETSVNAVAARGGTVTVALRGLGAGSTLVLLNGRRSPFHPFNTQSVNVNTMPSFGVQQVEVLRDGASAIYGSDAVAGVVNYITKKDPTGTEVSVRFGVTEHGGGADYQFNLGHGLTFADGKGSLLTSFTAYDRDYIWWRERDVSKTGNKSSTARAPWNVLNGPYDRMTQTSGKWVQFRVGDSARTGTVRRVFPINGTPTITTAKLPREYYSDYNKYTVGQPRSRRYNLFNRMEYQLTDSIRAFGELGYYYAYSSTHRQPITLSVSDARVTMAIDNPYNPLGSRFYSPTGANNSDGTARLTGTPNPITISAMLMEEGGIEDVFTRDRVVRALAGLSGSFGESTWTWESALMYGHVNSKDYVFNAVRDSKLDAAARRTDTTAWNPFGMTFKVDGGRVVYSAPFRNSDQVRGSFTETLTRFGKSSIFSADFRANGEIAEIWAGKISASTGAEFRREYREDTRPPFHNFNIPGTVNAAGIPLDPFNNDFLVTSPKGNLYASREIASAYAETIIPLVNTENNFPLVYSLEANASVRYEDYSDFGETTKPKFGLNYKPTSWAMVRASINEGFSAPQLDLLYQPASFSVSSPPGVRDNIRNNHFQSAGRPLDSFVLIRTYRLANESLQPEESEGRTVGIALDVPFVRGLSFTVDYWEIEQSNLIQAQGRDESLDNQLLRAFTQAQLAKGIPIDQIDVGSRTDPDTPGNYVGDPNTLRFAVTDTDRAAFAAANALLPAANQLAPLGVYAGVISQQVNRTGKNFTNGFDYNVSYSLPNTPLGQFRFSTEWSQFLNKFSKRTPAAPKDDDIASMAINEWKSNTTVSWRKDNWSGSISAVWTSDLRTGATTSAALYNSLGKPEYIRQVFNNGTTTYYEEGYDALQVNVGLSYRFQNDANKWVAGTTVRLGINNILDEEPSEAATASGYNPQTGGSLWVGRAYSLTFTRQF
jgi:iron complex outermembrane recepter protein